MKQIMQLLSLILIIGLAHLSLAQPVVDPFGGGFPIGYDAEIFTIGTQNDSLYSWAFDTLSGSDILDLIGEGGFPESYQDGENRDIAHGDFNGDFLDELVVVWALANGGVFVGIPTIDPFTLVPDPADWQVPEIPIDSGVLYATSGLSNVLGEIRVVAGNFYDDPAMEFVLAYLAADSTVTLIVFDVVFDVDSATLIPAPMATISDQAVNTDLPPLQQFGAVSRFDIATGDFDGNGLDEVALVVNDPAQSPATNLVLRIYDYDTLSHDLIPKDSIPYTANGDVDHPCLRTVLMETGNFEPDSLDEIAEIAILDSWSRSDVDSSRVGTLHTLKLNPEMTEIDASQMQSLPSCSWENDAAFFGPNGPVHIMTIYDGELIVGGKFTEVSGFAASASNIASWDGFRWKPLGAGVNDTVEALEVYGDDLIVGGSFTEAGGIPANHIARWDGNSWEEFGGGATNTVYDLLASVSVSGGSLFACGDFMQVGDTTATRIARWDGSVWQKVANGLSGGRAIEMMEDGDRLVVTGAFHWVSDTDRWHIVYWLPGTPTVWYYYGKGFFNNVDNNAGFGHAMDRAPDGDLIAGGNFTHVWGENIFGTDVWRAANNIGIYGGYQDPYWHPIGTEPGGYNNSVKDLLFDESDSTLLYVGGLFTTGPGVTASRIAQWKWPSGPSSALDSGVTATTGTAEVVDMCFYKGDLIAGGWFDQAGDIEASNIARWDGSDWHPLSGSDSQPPLFSIGLAVGRFNADSELDDIAITACATDLGNVRQYLRIYEVDTLEAALTLSERGETNLSGYCTDSALARSRRIIAVDDVTGDRRADLVVLSTEFSDKRIDIFEPCDTNNNCTFDFMPSTASWISGSDNMTQLVLADLDTSTATIGPPVIYHVEDLLQVLAIINAPPVHFDVLDTVCDVSNRYPIEASAGTLWDTYVHYYAAETWDSATVAELHNDWGVSAQLEAWYNVAGTGVSTYLNAEYGEGFSKKESHSERISIGEVVEARSGDQVKAVTLNYDILEYPVLNHGEIVGHVVVVDPIKQSLTGWADAESKDYLMPNHEVDNIFSYPRIADISNNPMMASGIIGDAGDYYTMMNNNVWSWFLVSDKFESSVGTNSWDASFAAGASFTYGSTYDVEAKVCGIGISTEVSWGAKASIEGNYGMGQISTLSTSFSKYDSLFVQLGWINSVGAVGDSPDNRMYKVVPYAYWAKNGALVIDYAVEPEIALQGGTPTWWQTHYSEPDPAFILHNRLDYEKWGTPVLDENMSKTKEIFFYPDSLAPGDSVIIGARVHNFSLVPTLDPVAVSFYLGNPDFGGMILHDKNSGDSIFYTHDTTGASVNIDAQGNAFASMVWQVPYEGSISSCQRIWAVIDPADMISPEVHDNDDPLTNNKGWKLLYVETSTICVDSDGDDWADPGIRCHTCPHPIFSLGEIADNCPTIPNPDQSYNPCVSCCGLYHIGFTGNTDCDDQGKCNLADITRLIDRVYISKNELCCEENGNVDGDAEDKKNLADITRLIDHVYISKVETAACN